MTINTEICNAFNAHAMDYDQAAIVQKEIGDRLFERLDYLKMKPRFVLDLGCGTGYFSKKLKQRYPKALVVGLDLAWMMLKQVRKRQSILSSWPLVHANMTSLPFSSGVFDLVFANQVIHWANPLSSVMSEINRILNVDGCFMFSTLGPDTFQELRTAWSQVHQYAHTNDFMDMHDLGDILLAEHFIDPVVDMEKLLAYYPSLSRLLHTLKDQGVRNINRARNQGLTGKDAFRRFETLMNQFCNEKGQFPLSYEIVYGHAWKGSKHKMGQGIEEAYIPISQLRRSRVVE